MQLSDKLKIWTIRLIKLFVFFVLLIVLNIWMSSRLEPLMHKSHRMWEKYFAQENADTIFIGTSVAEMIDAGIVSGATSRNCVNMATPSQYFGTSVTALTMAGEQNPVDTIVLLMGFDSLERDEDLTSTLSMEKALYYGAPKKTYIPRWILGNIEYSFEPRNITSTDSINKWFSWPVNATRNLAQIRTNKVEEIYNPLPNLYMTDNPPGLSDVRYKRKEFRKADQLIPLDKSTVREIRDIKSVNISENSLKLLSQMCEYSNSNGFRFVVMIAPHRSNYRGEFDGEYDKINEFLKNFVENRNCIYINLDNDADIKNKLSDEYFTDTEHVNDEGIRIASGIMADYLNGIN